MIEVDCQKARNCLHDYLSAELEPADVSRIDAHLQACSLCASRFAQWRSFRAAVRRAGQSEAVPALLRAQVVDRLRRAPAPTRMLWGLFPARWAAAAVLLCISVAVGASLLSRSAPPPVAVAPAVIASRPIAHPIQHMGAVLAGIVADQNDHGNDVSPADDQSSSEQSSAIASFVGRVGRGAIVPGTLASYRREQCHLCPVGATTYPHVQYRSGRKELSLFLVPAGELSIDGHPALRLQPRQPYCTSCSGENLVAWRQGATVYVLVSQQPRDDVLQVASAFPPEAVH